MIIGLGRIDRRYNERKIFIQPIVGIENSTAQRGFDFPGKVTEINAPPCSAEKKRL
jgi:hypothetical protein